MTYVQKIFTSLRGAMQYYFPIKRWLRHLGYLDQSYPQTPRPVIRPPSSDASSESKTKSTKPAASSSSGVSSMSKNESRIAICRESKIYCPGKDVVLAKTHTGPITLTYHKNADIISVGVGDGYSVNFTGAAIDAIYNFLYFDDAQNSCDAAGHAANSNGT